MGSKPYYPEGWRDSFGLTLEEHQQSVTVGYLGDYARFDVIHEKRSKKKKVKEVPTDQISLFDVAGGTDKEVKDE